MAIKHLMMTNNLEVLYTCLPVVFFSFLSAQSVRACVSVSSITILLDIDDRIPSSSSWSISNWSGLISSPSSIDPEITVRKKYHQVLRDIIPSDKIKCHHSDCDFMTETDGWNVDDEGRNLRWRIWVQNLRRDGCVGMGKFPRRDQDHIGEWAIRMSTG